MLPAGSKSSGRPTAWRDPITWIGVLVGGGATAWALFADGYLPYIDWSNHLGLISILAHGEQTGAAAYFERSFAPGPYLLFYALSALLAQLFAVDTAAKLVLVLTGAGLAAASADLCRATGRDPRLGLVGPLALFGLSMGWGFASFVVATPLFLLALARAEDVLRRIDQVEPPGRALIPLGVALALLYLAHGFAYFAAAVLLVLRTLAFAAARFRRGPAALLRPVRALALGALPSVLLTVPSLHALLGQPTVEQGASTHLVEWEPLAAHWAGIYGNLLDRGSVRHLYVMVAALSWAGLLLLVGLVRDRREPRQSRALELYAALLVLLYFFGPSGLGWPSSIWLLYPRFGVLAFLSLLLLPRARLDGARAALALPALALVLWNASINAEHVVNFSAVARGYDAVRKAIPPGARVLPLTVPAPGEPELPHHAHGSLYFYHLVDGASFVPFLFDKPELPVHSRPGVPRPRAPFWRSPGAYDPQTHGADYDFLVLRGRGLVERTEQAGLHERVGDFSGWMVFRTKAPPPR